MPRNLYAELSSLECSTNPPPDLFRYRGWRWGYSTEGKGQGFSSTRLGRGLSDQFKQESITSSCDESESRGSSDFISVYGMVGHKIGEKGRFSANLSINSKQWAKGSVRMETLWEFASSIGSKDYMMSMDVYKGYRLLPLHLTMRDWFIFRYNGTYYQYIALPFVWGSSPLWFTEVMKPFVQELRNYGYRVLAYMDDFLIIPPWLVVRCTSFHCATAKQKIKNLMIFLGIRLHPEKGCWEGSQIIQHLGVVINPVQMIFFVTPRKQKNVQSMVVSIMKQVRIRRRTIDKSLIASFCGMLVRRSIEDGMKAPIDELPFCPLGEHPMILRRLCFQALNERWSTDEVRLLCTPVGLITATFIELPQTKAPAILLLPDWLRQMWYIKLFWWHHSWRSCWFRRTNFGNRNGKSTKSGDNYNSTSTCKSCRRSCGRTNQNYLCRYWYLTECGRLGVSLCMEWSNIFIKDLSMEGMVTTLPGGEYGIVTDSIIACFRISGLVTNTAWVGKTTSVSFINTSIPISVKAGSLYVCWYARF